MNEIIYTKAFKLLDPFSLKYDNIPRPYIQDLISDKCEELSEKITMFKYNKYDTHIFIVKTMKEELKLIENIDSFIYKSINNACITSLNKKDVNQNLVSLDDIDITKTDNNLQEKITKEKQINYLLKLIGELNEKDQYFIRWWMMKDKTKEEIAAEWGIKPSSVYKTAKRALKKLKELHHKNNNND